MEAPLVYVDTETATFDSPPHLLELAAIRVVDGEVVNQFESLICPDVPISSEATDFHGITEECVRKAPKPASVLQNFVDWLGEDWLCAHNASADARTLAYEMARCEIAPPPGPFIDSLCLAKRLIPEAADHKLTTLAEHLELETGTLHRALADAVCAWQVVEACATRMDTAPTLATLLSLSGGHTTVASAMPPPPRLNQRTRSLEHARRLGETVQLLYGAPPAPARAVAVRPRLLFRNQKKSYLEAECQRSGVLKTYRLDRIQRVLPT